MFFVAVGLAVISAQTGGVKLPVHNVSSRYLLAQLAQRENLDFAAGVESPLAKGVLLFLDPSRNGLIAKGSEAGVRDLQELVNAFDVKPMGVRLEVRGMVPGIGFERGSDVTVSNTTAFRLEDPVADLGLALAPRVNADDTVTLFFTISRQGKQISTVIRVRLGDWVRLMVPSEGEITIKNDKVLERVLKMGSKPGEQDAVILVRATVPGG